MKATKKNAPGLGSNTERKASTDESSRKGAEKAILFDRVAFEEYYGRREHEGVIVVGRLPKEGGAQTAQVFESARQAADYAEKYADYNLYVVNNAPRSGWTPPNQQPRRGGGDPPADVDIMHRHRMQVDLDPAGNTNPEVARAAMRDAVAEVMGELRSAAEAIPEEERPPGRIGATELVDSGRGLHLHFEFMSPVISGTLATATNESIIERFRAHPGNGTLWKADGVGNPCRIMRAVGSVNHRTGTHARLLGRDEESRASLALWMRVLGVGDQPIHVAAAATANDISHNIDRRFDDKVRRYADRITSDRHKLLQDLASVEWGDIDKTLAPEVARLSEFATMQVLHGVAKLDDLGYDRDGRPVVKQSVDRSAAMEAAAGQMHREGVPIAGIAGILANPAHGISAHIYDIEKHKSDRSRCRAVVRAIAEAVLTDDTSLQERVVLDGAVLDAARKYRGHTRPTLLHQRGDYLDYAAGAYRAVEDATVRSELYGFLEGCDKLDKDGRPQPCVPNSRLVSQVEDALRAEAHVPAERYSPPCWLDDRTSTDPRDIVALPNGLLHLPSGELHPPDARFFTRNALGFDYAPSAPEPTAWLRFLTQLWPNSDEADCIEALQDFMGYTLTPDTSQQKALMLVGRKRSGKGTIGRVWAELVGRGNTTSPTLNSLSRDFGLEPLLGKQLAVVSDMRIGARSDPAAVAENLLRITGEDGVTVNRKYKSGYETTLAVRFVVMTNLLPKFSDTSGALASRFIILPMQQSFYGREDRGLTGMLLAELPGILHWAIAGWRRVRERGHLTEPVAGREAIEHMVDLATPIPAFIRECCRLDPEAVVEKNKLFSAFRVWHFDRYGAESRYSSKEWFSRDLYAAVDGVRGGRSNTEGKVYVGVELREIPVAEYGGHF